MSSAVNELADNMASISINEANGAAQAAANPDPSAVSADEGRRLYIGNLAYATTEGELKDFFQGFNVESTSIPVNPRTDRPVGYAFVDLATAQEAQDAIAALTGKEILEPEGALCCYEPTSAKIALRPIPHFMVKKLQARGEARKGRGFGFVTLGSEALKRWPSRRCTARMSTVVRSPSRSPSTAPEKKTKSLKVKLKKDRLRLPLTRPLLKFIHQKQSLFEQLREVHQSFVTVDWMSIWKYSAFFT
ncbi:glycine-rich protein [Microsporum canis CBS 113480]|uniref:Glycine-rich protein n=1 Tax=Arthroderma otae (strain ATCC MYA-4605 / CBS 113480) TaxID=554155 RepID=C5FW69_ARTOC|nr:glycine-rich protein [Microsporum canis CBS 113480]EEQ34153.1 glycine-rich protein [Microsporum canis CBS 113480]